MTQRNNITMLLGAVAAGLALGACGSPVQPSSTKSSPVVSGVASTGTAATTVTLKDSSTPAQIATATADATGVFTIDVSGLTGPYLLKAQWKGATGMERMYSMATAAGTANINELSDALMAGASGALSADDVYTTYSGKNSPATATSFMDLLRQLQTVLAPLFDLYGIANPISDDATRKTAGISAMLKDVRFTTSNGTVTVTNRATGGIIFQGPLNDLASGTFYPENMPAGPGPIDGAALYTANCAGCHGPLSTSSVKGATSAQIQSAISANLGGMGKFSSFSTAQIDAIAAALGSGTATTCTAFTYSAWGACQPDNTQARTVLTSSPAGCTGGSPVVSQSCTYVPPPPATCTAFTYSVWGACQPDNTQTRTILSSSPAGCTGGSPVVSQSCTYVPPPTTCTSFTYSAWGACQQNNTQTRTVLTSSPAGCTGGSPVVSQSCTYVPPVCTAFTYSTWGACQPDNTQTRTVLTSSPAGCAGGSPVTTQSCTYVPPPTTCTSFTYSAWGACQSNNTQTRTVLTSSPAGCTGGSPVVSQSCTYVPPNPVTSAMVVTSCTGCHGLTSNNTVFKSGGYAVTGRSASQWLTTVNNMVGLGARLAAGTTAQNYADFLANAP